MPFWLMYPPGNVVLKVALTFDSAQKFIDEHPNVLLRPLLKIRTEELSYEPTD